MANDLKAQLEISADASGVEAGVGKAKRSLADLGATAQTAGKQASDGLAKVGEGGTTAATKVDRATQNIIGSIQRTTAALDAGGRSSSAYYAVLAQQRGIDPNALKPYLDQLDAVAAKQKVAAAAIATTTAPLAQVGMSARATAAALRQVPAQFTDIVTSLQAGQAPLTVLLQQGGQLKDVFGGIGPAARALGGYVLGLINPLTLAAAAAAALAYAYYQGSQESLNYVKAIALSGNAAGVTAGQLGAMAKSIAVVTGSQSEAAAALAEFVQKGNVAGASLQRFATIAIQTQRDTGQAVSETVKNFNDLGKAPVDASAKLNESMHYLTLSTYAQIKAAEEQGRTADAAAIAQKSYADALQSQNSQIEASLGTIERAWRGIKVAASEAWNAMLQVGRASTLQDQLASAQAKLTDLQSRGALGARGGRRQSTTDNEVTEQQAAIAALSRRIVLENDVASATAAANAQVSARINFDKAGEQFTTNAVKMEREITKARNEGAAAGAKQSEIEARIGDIRKKYTEKGGANNALQIDKAELSSDIAAIKSASDRLTGIYGNQERILEATRAAGGLSDEEYYRKKRELIIVDAEIQDYALQQQIKRYEQEKLSGKDAIENQKKIAETESRLAILRADSAAKLTILSIQEEAAAKRLALSFLSARQAAQDYYEGVQRQQDRSLGGFGNGSDRRSFDAGVNQIEDRYAGQKRDLENQRAQLELEGKFTDDARAQYEERLKIINEFQAKSLASYDGYYAKLRAFEGDATLGAKEALQNYFDESQKLGKQTEAVVGKFLSGFEDALVEFSTTGKLTFKQLANSIIADLIRIQYRAALGAIVGQQTGQGTGANGGGGIFGSLITAAIGYFSGGMSTNGTGTSLPTSGGRAIGGPVSARGLYRVNEQQPELLSFGGSQYLMMGSQGGSVKPQQSGSASSQRPVNVRIVQQFAPGTTRQTTDQAAVSAGRQVARAAGRGNA